MPDRKYSSYSLDRIADMEIPEGVNVQKIVNAMELRRPGEGKDFADFLHFQNTKGEVDQEQLSGFLNELSDEYGVSRVPEVSAEDLPKEGFKAWDKPELETNYPSADKQMTSVRFPEYYQNEPPKHTGLGELRAGMEAATSPFSEEAFSAAGADEPQMMERQEKFEKQYPIRTGVSSAIGTMLNPAHLAMFVLSSVASGIATAPLLASEGTAAKVVGYLTNIGIRTEAASRWLGLVTAAETGDKEAAREATNSARKWILLFEGYGAALGGAKAVTSPNKKFMKPSEESARAIFNKENIEKNQSLMREAPKEPPPGSAKDTIMPKENLMYDQIPELEILGKELETASKDFPSELKAASELASTETKAVGDKYRGLEKLATEKQKFYKEQKAEQVGQLKEKEPIWKEYAQEDAGRLERKKTKEIKKDLSEEGVAPGEAFKGREREVLSSEVGGMPIKTDGALAALDDIISGDVLSRDANIGARKYLTELRDEIKYGSKNGEMPLRQYYAAYKRTSFEEGGKGVGEVMNKARAKMYEQISKESKTNPRISELTENVTAYREYKAPLSEYKKEVVGKGVGKLTGGDKVSGQLKDIEREVGVGLGELEKTTGKKLTEKIPEVQRTAREVAKEHRKILDAPRKQAVKLGEFVNTEVKKKVRKLERTKDRLLTRSERMSERAKVKGSESIDKILKKYEKYEGAPKNTEELVERLLVKEVDRVKDPWLKRAINESPKIADMYSRVQDWDLAARLLGENFWKRFSGPMVAPIYSPSMRVKAATMKFSDPTIRTKMASKFPKVSEFLFQKKGDEMIFGSELFNDALSFVGNDNAPTVGTFLRIIGDKDSREKLFKIMDNEDFKKDFIGGKQ